MKKVGLIFCLVFMSLITMAQFRQDTTLVYATPAFLKDPLRSNWNTKYIKIGTSWQLQLTDRKGFLREKITFEDKALEVRKGPYAFYENNEVKEEGEYDKGHKNDLWKKYFPNAKVSEKQNFWYGKLVGQYHAYWENGNLKIEGKYSNDKKVGLWEFYYSDSKLALRETFDENGKSLSRIYYDRDGNEIMDKSVIPIIN